MGYNEELGDSKELSYDLRQIYANMLGKTLNNILIYRGERNYKDWYEELDGLYIDISFKLKLDQIKEYRKMVEELNFLIRENPKAYFTKELENNKIHSKLKQINMFLLKMMEEHGIFGSKDSDLDGLWSLQIKNIL